MANNKQKSLTRLDNNYQLNLRYPDINEFLKDTFFSLQDNQTIERSLMSNPKIVLGSNRDVHTITVAGFSLSVMLSDIVLYAFSPNQEIINDFLIVPEIFGITLTSFIADRTTPETRLQSVQSMGLENSDKIANFNINITSKKVARMLTELCTNYQEELKTTLGVTDDFSLVTYILNNLFSLNFTFFCSYRLQLETAYQAAFRIPVELTYLLPSLSNQTAINSSKIDLVAYTPSRQSETAIIHPQLSFKGIYNYDGTLQLLQLSGTAKYLDDTIHAISKKDTLQEFTSTFRTNEYVWATIKNEKNIPPTFVYDYVFSVNNSNTKFAGLFNSFQSPATTSKPILIKASNYKLYLSTATGYSSNVSMYSVVCSFNLSSIGVNPTAFKNLFIQRTVDEGGQAIAPNLFIQMELLDTADKTLITAPHATYERLTTLTTFNPLNVYSTYNLVRPTLSGCFLYSSVGTDDDKSQFAKLTQRVVSTYSGLINFSSSNLSCIVTTAFKNVDGTLSVSISWPGLRANEVAALYQLHTASGIRVSLFDSFMNTLATTDKIYSTNNLLSRIESPLTNLSFFYYAKVTYKDTLAVAGTSISGLVNSVQGIVPATIRTIENSSGNLLSLLTYDARPTFNLINSIYCVATWNEVTLNKTIVQKWSSTIHRIKENQITITEQSITVSAAQKKEIATALGLSAAQYTIYVLLPWSTVRDLSTSKTSVVRSNLTSSKYTYAYALKV